MRHLHPPDEPDGRCHGHGRIDHERHPGTRGVDIDDAIAIALLVVGRGEHQPADEAPHDEQSGRPGEPRRETPRHTVNMWRRGESVKPGPGHRLLTPYSRLIRTAAAAASGASVRPSTASAARSCIGTP